MKHRRHGEAPELASWLSVAGELLDLSPRDQLRVIAVWVVDAAAGWVGCIRRLGLVSVGVVVARLSEALHLGAGLPR
jgi:hypothetical protein